MDAAPAIAISHWPARMDSTAEHTATNEVEHAVTMLSAGPFKFRR